MAKKSKETNEVSNTMSDADIAALLSSAAEMDGQAQAELGGNNRVPFIKCITKAEDPVLDKASPDFIPKAVYKGFCVPTSKTNLGTAFFYTVMGIFSIYEDKVKPEGKGTGEMAKIVKYWMPAQAQQIPIAEGSYFDREYIDKEGKVHILSPVHWVFGLIKDHEELGMHNMVFRSTASENAKNLQKILTGLKTAETDMSCKFVVKVTAEKKEFPKFNSVTFRPVFESTDRINFQMKGTTLIPKEWSKDEIGTYAKMYHTLQAYYHNSRMVANRDIADNVKEIVAPTKTKF